MFFLKEQSNGLRHVSIEFFLPTPDVIVPIHLCHRILVARASSLGERKAARCRGFARLRRADRFDWRSRLFRGRKGFGESLLLSSELVFLAALRPDPVQLHGVLPRIQIALFSHPTV